MEDSGRPGGCEQGCEDDRQRSPGLRISDAHELASADQQHHYDDGRDHNLNRLGPADQVERGGRAKQGHHNGPGSLLALPQPTGHHQHAEAHPDADDRDGGGAERRQEVPRQVLKTPMPVQQPRRDIEQSEQKHQPRGPSWYLAGCALQLPNEPSRLVRAGINSKTLGAAKRPGGSSRHRKRGSRIGHRPPTGRQGVAAGRRTRGLAFRPPEPIDVSCHDH